MRACIMSRSRRQQAAPLLRVAARPAAGVLCLLAIRHHGANPACPRAAAPDQGAGRCWPAPAKPPGDQQGRCASRLLPQRAGPHATRLRGGSRCAMRRAAGRQARASPQTGCSSARSQPRRRLRWWRRAAGCLTTSPHRHGAPRAAGWPQTRPPARQQAAGARHLCSPAQPGRLAPRQAPGSHPAHRLAPAALSGADAGAAEAAALLVS